MAAIVTTNMRIYAAEQFESGFSNESLYLFIGQTLPWINDSSPPTPIDCESDEAAAYRNMMSAKQIVPADVSLVAPRYNWTLGTVYQQYESNIDLFDPSSDLQPFYVVTSALNVYKCLSNGTSVAYPTGAPSTIMPTGTGTSVPILSDGYQWKYMFTINSADVLSFVTTEWIPVTTLTSNDGSNQWTVQQAAVPGTIDRIDILAQGSAYTQIPTVQIVGDGTGATAVATVSGGNLVAVTVTSTGSNYTYANLTIVCGGGDVTGNGATVQAVISPFEGHGADPVTELGAFYVLLDSKLTYDENGTFTVGNDYRQIGIWENPFLNGTTTVATALDYNQAVRLTFGSFSGTTFNADEVVTGGTSGATGVVLDWDGVSLLRLVQTLGTFVPGETVIGAHASGVLLTFSGTAVSATTNTIVLPNTASSAVGAYIGQTIKITGGPGSGQIKKIIGYANSSRTVTVASNWGTNPTSSSTFTIASIIAPDLQIFSGEIIYLENRRPIARSIDQVEDIRIVVEF